MTKVIAAGFSCVDLYKGLNKYYPTGNGIDWGIHLSRMGIRVSVLSVVGTDIYGEDMRKVLRKEDIDVSHLHVEKGDTCKMIMDLVNGNDRIHLEEIKGVMKNFSLTQEDLNFIKTFDYIHTDLFGNILNHLSEIKESGVKIIMDFSTFSDDPEYKADKFFENVDYAFLSYDKDDDYIVERIKEIQSHGPKVVTATLGEKGSLSWDGSTLYRQGIIPVNNIVNTVGAGDSFIAGFTYGIISKWDVQKCMLNGAKTASEVVSKFEPY